MDIFTIGFTKKTAKKFFDEIEKNHIDLVIDVRLNNTSQLAGFSKYPDIEFFLKKVCNVNYISDTFLAPTEQILKDYKSKKISWDDYVRQFSELMSRREIEDYICNKYSDLKNKGVCLLCSEEKAVHCHRSLIANHFYKVFGGKIVHI